MKKGLFSKNGKEAHNPYIDAQQETLELHGFYAKSAAQWRLIALISLVVMAISASGNVMQAMQVKTVPYIIEVDTLGKASVVTRADMASATPQRLVQASIATCIIDWRTVTADTELQRKMIERLSFFIAGAAKGVLREWYENNNPYEIAKSGRLIHVDIKGLPLPVSGNSYRIEWVENVRSHTGILLEQHTYEATVSIQIKPPTIDAVLLKNPGGVYITALSVSKVVGTPAQSNGHGLNTPDSE